MSGDRSSYSGDPTHSSSYYANQAQQRDSTAQNTTMDSQCGDPSCTTCSQSAKDTIQRLSHLTYAEPEEDYLRTMQGIGKAAGKMRSSTNPSELTGASLLSHFPSENIRSFGKPLSRSRRIKNHVRGWRGKPKKYPSGTQSGLFIEEQSAGNLIKGLYSAGIVDGCQGTNGDCALERALPQADTNSGFRSHAFAYREQVPDIADVQWSNQKYGPLTPER